MTAPSLEIIRAKKNELLAAAAKLEAEAEKARKQATDYEAAERVWMELGEADSVPRAAEAFAEPRASTNRSRKPDGVPPVPDMIFAALTDAKGRRLAPKDLLKFVRDTHWPQALATDIGSTAWRMAKDGRLTKKSGKYGLPPNGADLHP